MRSSLSNLILLGLFALLTLSGCRTEIPQLHPQYSLPTNSSKLLQDLSKIDAQGIREIGALSDPNVIEKIIAIAQLDSEDRLSAAYSDGNIRLWDLLTRQIVLKYNVGLVSTDTISFSGDGLSLITPNSVSTVSTESEYETATVLEGISLWDTRTGMQIGCFGFHCQPQREQYDSVTLGAILSPKGDWLVKYAQTALHMVNISGQTPNVIFSLDDPDSQTKQHIGRVSFDPSGEYFAVAYEEGEVTVYKFESATGNSNWINMFSMGGVQGTRRPVLSLTIDPTRTWLALLYENELQIWDLKSMKKKPSISFAIPSMKTITFDHSGNLLVVGTESGLRFINLQEKSEVAQFNNTEVASLFITSDNRLLVWGDTKGIIHLWGAMVP